MLKLLPYLSEAQKKLGKNKGILVYVAISLFIFLALRYIYRSIKKNSEEKKEVKRKREQVLELIDTTSPLDGSYSEEDFLPTAISIADRLEEAMTGVGTNEPVVFESLVNLTGAQLRDVYSAFGVRDEQDLFAWFDEDLSSSSFWEVVTDDNIEGCTAWLDQCSEREAMVSVWKKSGLNYK